MTRKPQQTCPRCDGRGEVRSRGKHLMCCPWCQGSGKVDVLPETPREDTDEPCS